MLISTDASARHGRCIRRKLAAIDVETVLVLRKSDRKLRCRLLQRLNVYWLVDGRAVIDSTRPLRSYVRNGLTRTWLRHICQYHLRIGIPYGTRIYAKRTQSTMCSRLWTGNDRFEPSRWCQQQVIRGARRVVRFVVCERHPVKRHDFKCMSIKLQVQIAVR